MTFCRCIYVNWYTALVSFFLCTFEISSTVVRIISPQYRYIVLYGFNKFIIHSIIANIGFCYSFRQDFYCGAVYPDVELQPLLSFPYLNVLYSPSFTFFMPLESNMSSIFSPRFKGRMLKFISDSFIHETLYQIVLKSGAVRFVTLLISDLSSLLVCLYGNLTICFIANAAKISPELYRYGLPLLPLFCTFKSLSCFNTAGSTNSVRSPLLSNISLYIFQFLLVPVLVA